MRASLRLFSRESAVDVAFIGLGNMGGHMARNLAKAGKSLAVFDVAPGASDRVVAGGGRVRVASSPGDAARGAAVVVTMLPSSPHVRAAYEGPGGVLEGMTAGALCVDSSTIEPAAARAVAAAVAARGGTLLDAPVSGGVGGAENATLTFMVGGEQEGFERAKALLALMGKNTVYCGASGNGQVVKICNNLVLAISMAGVSEAMNLGVALGMDAKTMATIINASSGRCWSSDTYNPVPGVLPNVPASREYTGGFAVDLMAKDISLAVAAAAAIKAPLPLGGPVQQLYHLLSSKGMGGKDFSVVYDFLKKKD